MNNKININKEDLHRLLEEHAKKRNKNFLMDILRIGLTPLAIGFIGYWGSNLIAEKQIQSAVLLAEQQREAANKLAEEEIKNTNLRSLADRDIAKLNQVKGIFQSIVDGINEKEDKVTIQLKISSLEIYRDLALGFLVSIRDNYKTEEEISKHADETIEKILRASQPDFSKKKFIGKKDDPLNLRVRLFDGYNFRECEFRNVNLYQSQFKQCCLKEVTFENVDLYEANFSEANLMNAKFIKCNLKNANFKNAKLDSVKFEDCTNLKDAKFTSWTLVKSERPIEIKTKGIDDRAVYKNLIEHHHDAMKKEVGVDSKVFQEFEILYNEKLNKLKQS